MHACGPLRVAHSIIRVQGRDDELVLEAQRLTGTKEKSALRLAQLTGSEPGATAVPRLLAHPRVTGELAPGHLSRRSEILGLPGNLPQARSATDREVLTMIDDHQLFGLGVGWSRRTCWTRLC